MAIDASHRPGYKRNSRRKADRVNRISRLSYTSHGVQTVGGISERHKEIKRRRHRRKKLKLLGKKLKTAKVSERPVIADKLRNLTPGADVIIANWQLTKSDR